MTPEQSAKLVEALDYCVSEDKSIEFTMQYIHDVTGLAHINILKFLMTVELEEKEPRDARD